MSRAYKKLNVAFYHSLLQKKADMAGHMKCHLLALYRLQQIYFFIFMLLNAKPPNFLLGQISLQKVKGSIVGPWICYY